MRNFSSSLYIIAAIRFYIKINIYLPLYRSHFLLSVYTLREMYILLKFIQLQFACIIQENTPQKGQKLVWTQQSEHAN